jgi:hypothetical protein
MRPYNSVEMLRVVQHLAVHAVWDTDDVMSEVMIGLFAQPDPLAFECWRILLPPFEELYFAQSPQRRMVFFGDAHADGGVVCALARDFIS